MVLYEPAVSSGWNVSKQILCHDNCQSNVLFDQSNGTMFHVTWPVETKGKRKTAPCPGAALALRKEVSKILYFLEHGPY